MRTKKLIASLLLVATLISSFNIAFATEVSTSTLEGVTTSPSPVVPELVFTDVTLDDWYYDFVTEMYNLDIIHGYPDGTFKPNNQVTHGEFFTLLLNSLGINYDDKKTDENIAEHWAYPAFEKLRYALLRENTRVDGYLDTEITRESAIKLAMLVAGVNNPVDYTIMEHDITDIDRCGKMYAGYVAAANKLGIISGDQNGNFLPHEGLTRAAACKILYNVRELCAQALADGKEHLEIPLPDFMEGISIKCEGVYTDSHIPGVAKALSYYPDSVKDKFRDCGSVIITDEPSTKYTGVSVSANGCYTPGTGKIHLFTDGQMNSLLFDVTSTMAHELSHFIWDKMLSGADQKIIKDSFNRGDAEIIAKAIGREYCKTNVDEYWAELASNYAKNYYKQSIINTGLTDVLDVLERNIAN